MYQFIILILFTILVRENISERVCLYNWELSSDRQECILKCDWRANRSELSSYCNSVVLPGVKVEFNSSNQTFSMPTGKSLQKFLPNYSFKEKVFRSNSYSNRLKSKKRAYQINRVEGVGSPQFLQCETRRTSWGEYYLDKSRAKVVIPERNLSAYLGDFYIDQDRSVHTCPRNIDVNPFEVPLPRCNYITVRSGDYEIFPNGSVTLTKAGFVIKNPIYSLIIGDFILICVPLSIEFVNCPRKQLISPHEYFFNNRLQLTMNGVVDLDSYFFAQEGYVVCCGCQSSKLTKLKMLQVVVNTVVDYISTFCLVLVLIFRFRMFVKNNHTRCMLFHLSCLTISNVSSSFNPTKYSAATPTVVFCITFYFFLSGTLWLNAISLDSWQYFTRMQAFSTFPRTRASKLTTFILYNVYSWGVSLVLLLFLLHLEFLSPKCQTTFGLCPHFRFKGYFNNQDAYLIFFCIPLNICTLINLIFLVLIIRIIYQAGVGTELVNNQRIKQIVRMSMKLFVLTGSCYTVIMLGSILMLIRPQLFISLLTLNNFILNCQGIIIFLTYYSSAEMFSIFQRICHRQK